MALATVKPFENIEVDKNRGKESVGGNDNVNGGYYH